MTRIAASLPKTISVALSDASHVSDQLHIHVHGQSAAASSLRQIKPHLHSPPHEA
jgi:hypothetical protein